MIKAWKAKKNTIWYIGHRYIELSALKCASSVPFFLAVVDLLPPFFWCHFQVTQPSYKKSFCICLYYHHQQMLRYAVRKDLSSLYEKGQKALDNSNVEKAMYEFVFFKLLENSLGIFTHNLIAVSANYKTHHFIFPLLLC